MTINAAYRRLAIAILELDVATLAARLRADYAQSWAAAHTGTNAASATVAD